LTDYLTDNSKWSIPKELDKVWAVFRHGDIDVVPTNDDKEHIAGQDCECNPVAKIEGATVIYVHNAFDFREVAEEMDILIEQVTNE